jgi:hypothetical protein
MGARSNVDLKNGHVQCANSKKKKKKKKKKSNMALSQTIFIH